MYRRLLSFLRPHRWRMAGSVACNIAAAVLDVFSFTLLIPFLDRLFDQPPRGTPISALHERIIGSLLDESNPQAAPYELSGETLKVQTDPAGTDRSPAVSSTRPS